MRSINQENPISLCNKQTGSLGGSIESIYEQSLYLDSLYYFLQLDLPKKTESLPFPIKGFEKIIVKELTFRYPSSENYVLRNVSFEIKKGQKVAIVGENGAGKSTLVNCLLGLYNPTEGGIYLDDLDIQNVDPKSYREKVSAILQDFMKYKLSLRENISFGNISELHNDQLITEVLDKVNMKYLLTQLKYGIDHKLSKEFINGDDVSGGQWQRIATARALIKNSEILILDEPTSNLDPYAEINLFKTFLELADDKTAIMITHRLGPAKFADKIIVLDNGYIIESGKHDELMSKKGRYYEMYSAQSSLYI